MSWNKQTSLQRIRHFMATSPKTAINLRTFDQSFLEGRRKIIHERMAFDGRREPLIADVSENSAILVEGVHVYIQMLDFSAAMIERDRETEASHRRVLTMLHLNYAACDQVADQYEAQRVDFHGSRMHAVIVSPPGPENAADRAERALAFADAAKRAIDEVGRTTEGGRYSTRIRIGVDSGPAVAINSGSANEREPLFLGRPANYAAKLAEGEQEGIFISNRVRKDLGLQAALGADELLTERSVRTSLSESVGLAGRLSLQSRRMDEAAIATAADAARIHFSLEMGTAATFAFHRHTPPLTTVDFSLLMPSKSIRMGLVSIFGDIDGFTKYVDWCIASGQIPQMVSNLHVIRSELAASLSEDFEGRKVRFIGDCIHGVLACGTAFETDGPESVTEAVEAVSGMRSSFELCQSELGGIDNLGIAFGLEFGETPITRIGIRGDRSVRCSVSRAVSRSEDLQKRCNGQQTAIGPSALSLAPAAIRRLFEDGVAWGLDAESLAEHLSPPQIITRGSATAMAAPYSRRP